MLGSERNQYVWDMMWLKFVTVSDKRPKKKKNINEKKMCSVMTNQSNDNQVSTDEEELRQKKQKQSRT